MKWSLAAVDKFIISTFCMVVALAYPTWNSLAGDSGKALSLKVVSIPKAAQAERFIASVPVGIEVKAQTSHFESAFDLHCGRKTDNVQLQIHGDYVQLYGNNCWENQAVNAVEIENVTNGYSATVFQQKGRKYKTDLIQLRSGSNEIKIRFHSNTGSITEQKITVLAN